MEGTQSKTMLFKCPHKPTLGCKETGSEGRRKHKNKNKNSMNMKKQPTIYSVASLGNLIKAYQKLAILRRPVSADGTSMEILKGIKTQLIAGKFQVPPASRIDRSREMEKLGVNLVQNAIILELEP